MPLLLHPLVVHFPIALWLTSALFDLLYLGRGDRFHFRAAHVLIGLGLLGALLAIVAGYKDLWMLAAEGIGQPFLDAHTGHARPAFAATAVYAVSFAVRWRVPHISRVVLAALMLAGAFLIAYVGWNGGELRLKV